MTLAEIAAHLEGSHGLRVALSTVWRFFERRGITLKKTAHASEQEQPNVVRRRRAWFEAQPDLDPERLVFIDETGASTKMARHYGRSKRGTRCRAPIPHGHWKTITFVGGWRHGTTEATREAGHQPARALGRTRYGRCHGMPGCGSLPTRGCGRCAPGRRLLDHRALQLSGFGADGASQLGARAGCRCS